MAVAKWESCTWLSQLEEENYPSRPYSIHDGGGWSVHPQAQEFLISSNGRHPSTGSARRNQDGTQTLQYIHPSSFPSVSYVSGYRPKSVLARHAPYFLNSWIKIYTFNSRQQPTYQHSTFVSSSLPSLSSLFPFQIRKTRPQRLPPFFFFFGRLGSVLRSFVIHILVNNWAYIWLTPIYVLRMRTDLKGGGSRFTNNTTFTAILLNKPCAGRFTAHFNQGDGQTLPRQVGWSTAAGMYGT